MTDPGALTITDFLLTRIAEDEQVARETSHSTGWRYDPGKVNAVGREESVFAGPTGARAITIASTGPEDDPQSMMDARHIARFDPARILAECKAKRAIVEREEKGLRDAWRQRSAEHMQTWEDWASEWQELMSPDLCDLAAVYASHPDYDPTWALEAGS